ncbi:hypothetical protein ACN28S_10290 [Cystobacter fuscus]
MDTKFRSPRFDAVKAEIKRRETAEYRRLLYVALTRAQDRLLLSGGEERNAADSWWCLLGARLDEDSRLRGPVEDLDARTLPEPPEVDLSEDVDEAEQEARVETAWQRVHARRDAAVPESVTVEAGAVQDFIACPRRYHYVHRLGLRADGVAWEAPPRQSALYVERDSWGAPAPSIPDRVLALVRRVDFRLAGTPAPERRSRLEALAREVGWAVEEEGVEAALAILARFLDTACAQELAAVPERGCTAHCPSSWICREWRPRPWRGSWTCCGRPRRGRPGAWCSYRAVGLPGDSRRMRTSWRPWPWRPGDWSVKTSPCGSELSSWAGTCWSQSSPRKKQTYSFPPSA